jgi:SNF2 family DNA or RNA helicase
VKHELWLPHEYQVNAINFTMENFKRERCSALFLQPGLGKTSITLEVFRMLRQQGLAKKMLVIAPLRVAQNTWPSEMYRWLNFSGMTYAVLHGPNKDREALRDVDVYIINYEGIPWLFSKSKFWQCDMLVMDELTRLKSWTAQRVKVLKPFLATFKYRLGLTGTPAPNGLQDLFSQIYMLDLGKRFGHRITKFMDRYFKPPSLYSYKREIQPWAPDQIHEKLKDLAFSLDADDWLKLPTEIHNVIHLELPDSLKAKYHELKKEFILQLETAVITAHSASVLSTKLRQYLSGSVYVDGIPHPAHSVKYDYLKEFVEDLEGPLLVAYQYRHEVVRLKALFPHAVVIDNTVKVDQLNTIIRDWNAGKIQMLIGHPQSVGHGLNLQAGGNNILFFSLDYNLETYQQFIKRVSRQGQKESHVFIHYLVFQGTLDEHVLATLQGKDEVQKTLLDFLNENN